MKITLYFDVIPGVEARYLIAVTCPSEKMLNAVRYRLDFEIADPYLPDDILKPAVTVELPA